MTLQRFEIFVTIQACVCFVQACNLRACGAAYAAIGRWKVPDTAQNVAEFCQMINNLCPAREESEAWVCDMNVMSVGCVDPHTQNGDWNLPGSAVFLFLDNPELLEVFFSLRRGRQVTFFTHTQCGLKFARGFRTVEEQEVLARNFSEHVRVLAQKYGCTVHIEVEPVGSAAPYMTRKLAAD